MSLRNRKSEEEEIVEKLSRQLRNTDSSMTPLCYLQIIIVRSFTSGQI